MLKIGPRWRKALRDLWLNRTRTALAVLAIAIGIFGVGSVLVSYSILMRELDANYLVTNPASATLWTDPLDDDFVQTVRNLPEVAEAEGWRKVVGRLQTGPDKWLPLWLFIVDDYDDLRIDLFKPEEGAWPPQDGEILLERQALSVARAEIGDTLVVKTPNNPARELHLVGSVHAPGLAPAWMENLAYGYITRNTLAELGESPVLDELKLVVAENRFDEEHIRRTLNQITAWIEQGGRGVYRVQIPPPGEHPHNDQMASFLFLLGAFGLLALALSGVLVVNMISALLAGQVRQIGMMKAIGARTRQVMGVYLGTVTILGLAALGLALPLGVWAGRAYSSFVAGMLNFDILSARIPLWVFALQITIGLLVPILASAFPIYRGSRVTVHQALGDYGVGQGRFGSSSFDLVLGRIRGLARPLLLSIRNTFRRRERLALTLGTLAVGGAIFIVAMNVRASLYNTVKVSFDARPYDIELQFSRPYPIERIEESTRNLPGVAQVESWGSAKAAVVYPDGTTGLRFDLFAPPPTTELIDFDLMEGRGLRPGDENAVVVNHTLLDWEPSIRVGEEIVLKIDGQETVWRVVGTVRQVLIPPTIYANHDYFSEITGSVNQARDVRVVAERHDADSQSAILQSLERRLQDSGLDVLVTRRMADWEKIIDDHILVITTFLMLTSVLIVFVGGLGLTSTMSINVIERTREIGVMRAIGASNRAVLRIIVVEGALVGVLSWLLALLLAPLPSLVIGNVFGMIIMQTTLDFSFSPLGFGLWFIIVVVFSGVASFYPAWSAARLTVHEVLAYE